MSAPVESNGGVIPRRATLVWLGLVLATVVTFWLGNRHPFGSVGLAATIAITVGIGKATFIGLEFMELRHAPPWLCYAFLAWCAALGGGLLLLYVL